MTTEAEAIVLVAFVILALVPTVASFALKSGRGILAFVAAGAWMLLGVYNYTASTATWDINYSLFWLSMGMVIVCALIPAILREKKEIEPTIDDIDDDDKPLLAEMEASERDRERYDRLLGRATRRKRTRSSSYSRTGIVK